MSCTHSHHTNDLYHVSGKMTREHFDQTGLYPCHAHIHLMVMICTLCLVK